LLRSRGFLDTATGDHLSRPGFPAVVCTSPIASLRSARRGSFKRSRPLFPGRPCSYCCLWPGCGSYFSPWKCAAPCRWFDDATHSIHLGTDDPDPVRSVPRACPGGWGTVRLSQRRGGYQITIFTAPVPFRAGPVDISVLVQDAVTAAPIPDARIEIGVAPSGCPQEQVRTRATAEAATNKLFQAASFELPTAGRWQVEVAINGPRGHARVQVEVEVAEPQPRCRSWRSGSPCRSCRSCYSVFIKCWFTAVSVVCPSRDAIWFSPWSFAKNLMTTTLASQNPATGGPGIEPRWSRSDKDGVGTAYSSLAGLVHHLPGILNEVYFPTIDQPQIRDLQYLITDGETFFHDEHRHLQTSMNTSPITRSAFASQCRSRGTLSHPQGSHRRSAPRVCPDAHSLRGRTQAASPA